MGKPKKKEVGNPSTTSEQPQPEKKKGKSLKASKKIVKNASKRKSEISEKLNTEDSKTVKDITNKVDESTQVNEYSEATAKETQANTNETFGGLIFMCNGRTKHDCFHYKVLGLPEHRKDLVLRVKPGMRLFLYDFDLKLLYGIFKASSCGGMKLEPAAFNGLYSAQVRYEIERACAPLPQHIFKHAIKENYTGIRNMFKTELSAQQVKELIKLFPSLPPHQSIFNMDAPVRKPVQVLTRVPAPAPMPGPVQFVARAPAPAPAPTPTPTPMPGPVQFVARVPAPPPMPEPVQVLAPAPAPAPAPVAVLWPSMLPLDGPVPVQREIVAPINTLQLDPRSLIEQDYINLGLNPNHFSVPHGNVPEIYTHPYGSAGPYETKADYLNDPSRRRLDEVGFSLRPLAHPQPAPHVRLLPTSGDARLGEMHLVHAPITLSGYSERNSQPVSSRYTFAGPSMSQKHGRAL
ncbi:BCL-6 corepressor-like protein 1 [Phalaenopsis equestris]|uniref:BCL-6 corepressor-like protein 1 n=1 Tax=Phalaenopsis equestris TaxID=78828 RepID=UPI0009E43272|nr:BCL-6 corepressor-like protein 1 [Phalaenopsis equestris]XP_020579175.1 BCL-6 corepressor-like protein 1 [Phalaenopsis equestris]XP_020579184.1 BCL-6 corepressor-like protein 1 [Phalaenopsis equestris]